MCERPDVRAIAQQRRAPIWLLALITLSGTMAMHIFVPALPAAAVDLKSAPAALQLTISSYILGLACGQLVYGPLSDRYGRKPVLLFGLVLYTTAGVACAFSPSVDTLIVARLFQGFGGCAGMVLGRAIVRDQSEAGDATRRLSIVNLFVIVGPGLAPIVGGLFASTIGWRPIFVTTVALGVCNIWLLLTMLAEPSRPKDGASFRRTFENYIKLAISPRFLSLAMGGASATTSLYAFVTSAPFIFIDELHFSARESGVFMAVVILAVWAGSMATSRMPHSMTPWRILLLASSISVVGTMAFVVLAFGGGISLAQVLSVMCLYGFGVGMASAPAVIVSIGVNTSTIGSASGL